MLFVAFTVFATGALCYGAYKLGRRSDLWSVVLAPLLMLAGWRVLLAPTIGQGEGAASGVVVIQAGIWYVGGMCVLLALTLLGTSLYVRRSTVAGVVLFVVGSAVLILGYRLATARGPESTARREPPHGAVAPRDTYLEGYAWAMDEGIHTDSACTGGPAFIDGCKQAVHRRNNYAKPKGAP